MIVRHSDAEKRHSWKMVLFSRATNPSVAKWRKFGISNVKMKEAGPKKKEEREER